jgi:hypothetical protein
MQLVMAHWDRQRRKKIRSQCTAVYAFNMSVRLIPALLSLVDFNDRTKEWFASRGSQRKACNKEEGREEVELTEKPRFCASDSWVDEGAPFHRQRSEDSRTIG